MSKKVKTKTQTKEKKLVGTVLELGEKIKQLERQEIKISAFKATISGEKVISKDKKARELNDKSCFGELVEGKVYYSLIEALYLLEKKKITVYQGKKRLNFDKLLELARSLEPNFYTRYQVFKDIRSRGYIVKTALKFGADFRVYDRGIKPGQDHARWVLFPVYETSGLTWHEFAAKNRVAHSTKKNLLIAIVDEEGDVTYYEIKWTRP